MADVPLSLAIISTVTPVISGFVPFTVSTVRAAVREKRAAAERRRQEQAERVLRERGQCLKLLRLTRDFRVLVENTYDSTGDELIANAERVRQSAADIASQADNVEFMVSGVNAQALSLATVAGQLGAPIADKENRKLGTPLLPPDFTEFDQCLVEFKRAAQALLAEQSAVSPDNSGSGNASGPALAAPDESPDSSA